ncbi:unnamed protein product [Xylocopa violacea]|uniref:BHLH domain-containing protein n=1 Tax=Xylocopa violacea TaxID=135666 RepID=A0ABP1PCL3_XYLVO
MAARKKEESSKQRYQANARERDRTHRSTLSSPKFANTLNKDKESKRETQEIQSSLYSVNTAFSALRTLIPTEPADRKLSKIETLRLASSYISHLGAVLLAGPIDQPCLRLDDSDDVYGTNHWADSQKRLQVCTFCLAMHKKYNLNITKEVIPNY